MVKVLGKNSKRIYKTKPELSFFSASEKARGKKVEIKKLRIIKENVLKTSLFWNELTARVDGDKTAAAFVARLINFDLQ